MFTDIQKDGWVGRVPEKWRPYVYLARLDRPIGVWLLLLPSWWGILLALSQYMGLFRGAWLIFIFAVGAVVMRGAGCVINDIWDRKLDAEVERTKARPLASGAVSLMQALGFLAVLLFIGFCILLSFNSMTIVLGLLALPLVIAYPLMKRVTFWPQAFLGFTFNFGALMGWSAVAGEVSWIALLLYAGGFCWTMAYDSIYAHQDKEDDALIGVRSTALLWGERSREWVAGFLAGSVALLAGALYLSGGVLIALIGAGCLGTHAVWQLKTWDMNDQASCLRVFKANRYYGMIMAALCIAAIALNVMSAMNSV